MGRYQDALTEFDLDAVSAANPGFEVPAIRPQTLQILEGIVDARDAESPPYGLMHSVATDARRYVALNRDQFESERLALSRMHVIQCAALAQRLKAHADGRTHQAIRNDIGRFRAYSIVLTNAAMIAGGWPHMGEAVTAEIWTADTGDHPETREFVVGTYVRAHDVARTLHIVSRLGHGATGTTQSAFDPQFSGFVRWDSAASRIELHCADAPDLRLPRPYPLDPKWSDVGLVEFDESTRSPSAPRGPEAASTESDTQPSLFF